jgi:hypothetical protein
MASIQLIQKCWLWHAEHIAGHLNAQHLLFDCLEGLLNILRTVVLMEFSGGILRMRNHKYKNNI